MSAGFLAKPLIVEVYRSFVDYGMEQASEELTAKYSIRLLELYDWHISRVEGNIKTRAQISYPLHLWHTIEAAE